MTSSLHPEPPPNFNRISLPLKKIRIPILRIFRIGEPPIFFGKSGNNRFDAPDKEYSILYAGRDEFCAFIETFGHTTGYNFITQEEIEERGMIKIKLKQTLHLVDLTGHGLAQIGADNRLCSGDNIQIAQVWALALFNHHMKPDGIWYRPRHDPARFAAAVFDRAKNKLNKKPVILVNKFSSSEHKALLAKLLDHYSFGLM